MKIEYLNEFITLVLRKNYSRAAEELFISQSTLTKHIQQLERELGFALIRSDKKEFTLTQNGELFLPYAMQITNVQREYTEKLVNPHAEANQSLNIGAAHLTAFEKQILLETMKKFSAEYPDCSIQTYRLRHFDHCKGLLRNGTISLAFCEMSNSNFLDSDNSILEITIFYQTPLVFILPKDHPLAGTKVNIQQLANENFISFTHQTYRHYCLLDVCKEAGFKPNVTYTVETQEAVSYFVSIGKGIALIPEANLDTVPLDHVCVSYPDPPLCESVGVICSHGLLPHSREKKFIGYLNETANELISRKGAQPCL